MSKGYGTTTIADIARDAGVAVETVYAAFRNKRTLLRQVWFVSFRGDEEDIRLWDRPEIHAVIAEPDLALRFKAQAAVYPAVFRRITPLLLMLQGAAASQPDAAAMLAEFDERRLDAAAKYRARRLPRASWQSVKTSAATCFALGDFGRRPVASAGCRTRLVGRAIRGLAGQTLDFRIGHPLEPGNRAPPHGGETSGGVLPLASDDDGGRIHARLRESQGRLRASGNRAPPHGGGTSGGVLPLRATTTAAESTRDCASNHQTNWRVSASRYAKRAPVDQHPPGSTPQPFPRSGIGWNLPDGWSSPQRPPHLS